MQTLCKTQFPSSTTINHNRPQILTHPLSKIKTSCRVLARHTIQIITITNKEMILKQKVSACRRIFSSTQCNDKDEEKVVAADVIPSRHVILMSAVVWFLLTCLSGGY